VLRHCWLGGRKGIRPLKMGDGGSEHWLIQMEWRPAGRSVYLPDIAIFVLKRDFKLQLTNQLAPMSLYFCPVVSSSSLFLFSSPNLRRHRLDVCYTSAHGVALVCFCLWSPYVIGRPYIFSCCFFFFFFFFFPRLISAAADWMSTILRHMVWS